MEVLVDFFVVCGLPLDAFQPISTAGRDRTTLQPQVLVHYPEVGSFDEVAVRTLCMPDGVAFKKNLEEEPHDPFEFHSFILTREDGSHAYGCVTTFFEPLQSDLVASICHLQKEGQFLSLPIEIDPKDSVYVSKCLCTVSAYPVILPLRDFLGQLVHSIHTDATLDMPLESFLYQLLFQVTMPSPGQKITFQGPQRKISWEYPDSSYFPLLDYSMSEFVELVGLRNLIMLYTTVLLEHQLLFQSSSYDLLMLCAQCTASLLYPFEWQHVLVPILPFSQRDFLDAPVPFIMGIKVGKSDTDMEFPEVSSLCIYDIDQRIFTSSDDLPRLPLEKNLLKNIRKTMETYDVKCFDMHIAPLPTHEDSRSIGKGSIMEAVEYVTSQLRGAPSSGFLSDSSNPHVEKLLSIMSRLPMVQDSPVGAGAQDLSTMSPKNGIPSYDQLFCKDLREVFFDYMVELFSDYEDFVIIPQQSYEQWTRDREQFQNFDKTSFLSDQSPSTIPFLSSFIESQMFSYFIDQKIIALWQIPDVHKGIIAFDDHIKAHLEKTGRLVSQSPKPRPQAAEGPVQKSSIVAENLVTISEGTSSWDRGVFPRLMNDSILKRSPQAIVIPTKRQNPTPDRRLHMSSVSPGSFSLSSHSQFILQLWRETRMRVKHILSTDADSATGMEEENTMIAKLCDLLERIWGHGVRKRNSRSPLWSHLMAYCDSHQVVDAESLQESFQNSEMPTSVSFSSDTPLAHRTESIKLNIHRQKIQSPENKSKIKSIVAPPKPNFFDDLKIVNSIPEIKTEVGRVRAFVRLALEKKVLAHHLKLLLANHGLLVQLYQGYAFLRTEEEREQFLTFLLTLSARQYMCFTSAFKNAVMNYRVLVLGEGKHLGLSTTNLYCNLSGEFRSSGVKIFNHGSNELEFQCLNLGTITCLRIGHDNSGAVRSLFVHSILAHNITTGQIYKFVGDRWLSKSEDDCAVERFLVGELIPADAVGRIVDETKVFPATVRKKVKFAMQDTGTPSLSEVKGNFDLSIKALLDLYKQSSKGLNQHGKILQHIHNPFNGFATCLKQLLLWGFSGISKYPFFWDFFSGVLLTNKLDITPGLMHSAQTLLHAVGKIEGHCLSIGKDERLVLLIGIGLRDHQLMEWIKVVVSLPLFSPFYDNESIFNDAELHEYLCSMLEQLSDVDLPMGDLFLNSL
jgi:hypothetical protein